MRVRISVRQTIFLGATAADFGATNMAMALLNDRQVFFITEFLGVAMPGAGEAASETGDDGIGKAIEAYLSTLPGDLARLAQGDATLAGTLGGEVETARALRARGELQAALAMLESVADRLAKAKGQRRAEEAGAAVPEGLVKERVRAIEIARSQWQVDRLRTVDGLGELVAELSQEPDPDLLEIAIRIASLARDIPDALDKALAGLVRAVGTADESAIAQAVRAVATAVTEVEGYLKANRTDLGNCEENPYGIEIDAAGTFDAAIRSIRQSLERI